MAKNLNEQQHRGHPKRVVFLPRGGQGPGRHYAKLECRLCGKWIRWVSKHELLASS